MGDHALCPCAVGMTCLMMEQRRHAKSCHPLGVRDCRGGKAGRPPARDGPPCTPPPGRHRLAVITSYGSCVGTAGRRLVCRLPQLRGRPPQPGSRCEHPPSPPPRGPRSSPPRPAPPRPVVAAQSRTRAFAGCPEAAQSPHAMTWTTKLARSPGGRRRWPPRSDAAAASRPPTRAGPPPSCGPRTWASRGRRRGQPLPAVRPRGGAGARPIRCSLGALPMAGPLSSFRGSSGVFEFLLPPAVWGQ